MGLFGLDFLNKLSALQPAANFYAKNVMGTNLQNLLGNKKPTNWELHDEMNANLAGKYMQMYGGWNRQQRDAKGFNSAYDSATRWPEDTELLKILAALYQGKDALQSVFIPGEQFTVKDNFYDYRANIAGIEAAEKMKGKKPVADSREMEEMSVRYADPFGDTTK